MISGCLFQTRNYWLTELILPTKKNAHTLNPLLWNPTFQKKTIIENQPTSTNQISSFADIIMTHTPSDSVLWRQRSLPFTAIPTRMQRHRGLWQMPAWAGPTGPHSSRPSGVMAKAVLTLQHAWLPTFFFYPSNVAYSITRWDGGVWSDATHWGSWSLITTVAHDLIEISLACEPPTDRMIRAFGKPPGVLHVSGAKRGKPRRKSHSPRFYGFPKSSRLEYWSILWYWYSKPVGRFLTRHLHVESNIVESNPFKCVNIAASSEYSSKSLAMLISSNDLNSFRSSEPQKEWYYCSQTFDDDALSVDRL